MSASYKVPGIRRKASNEIPLNHPGISCVVSRWVCLTQRWAGISMGSKSGSELTIDTRRFDFQKNASCASYSRSIDCEL
jgi:hypothetical protein